MKRALLTGSSGFLGGYFKRNLKASQFEVDEVNRSEGDYKHDLSKGPFQLEHIYDLVIHNAGLAHSPQSDERLYFKVNLEGTKNLIESLNAVPKTFVFISTIAVYGLERGEGVSEEFPLKGESPYAKSKILAEEFLQDWAKTNQVSLFILRLPLVVGENPPGNLGKMINAIRKGLYFNVNGGIARRSMVLASDVSKLVSIIGEKQSGIYNLSDGQHPSYKEIQDVIVAHFKTRKPLSLPGWLAKVLGRIGDILPFRFPVNSSTIEKLNSTLIIDDERARKELNWQPNLVLENFKGF